jgi:hypothetical protein
MGIYYVKSKMCNCVGSWCTLTNDHRVYISKYCEQHKLTEGNKIYYELGHLLKYITIPQTSHKPYKDKYLVKILEIKETSRDKKIIKIELDDNGEINVDNFNVSKQIYYSNFNDESMWKRINENTIQFILLYQAPHHTAEFGWEPADY